MNQLYIYVYIHDGILELIEMSFAGKRGGWVRYRYSYIGIGIGQNVISLLEWEMWVSSFVQSLVRKYGMCVGVGGGLFLIRVQQHWKQKRKTKDTKEIYKKMIRTIYEWGTERQLQWINYKKDEHTKTFAWDNFGHLHIDLVFSVFS